MKIAEMKEVLSKRLKEKRYKHSLSVAVTAGQLAKRYGVCVEKAEISGLLHDCARAFAVNEMIEQANKRQIFFSDIERHVPILLHAALGADMIEESYGIKDPAIKQAIRFHTVGGAGMSMLDKIIYLADMIEPGRDFPDIAALRCLAEENLDQAMLLAFNQSLQFVLKKNSVIHPDTVLARNEILLKG
jgi:predicted HD superfamily hydrolase involved in NAD metabolism